MILAIVNSQRVQSAHTGDTLRDFSCGSGVANPPNGVERPGGNIEYSTQIGAIAPLSYCCTMDVPGFGDQGAALSQVWVQPVRAL